MLMSLAIAEVVILAVVGLSSWLALGGFLGRGRNMKRWRAYIQRVSHPESSSGTNDTPLEPREAKAEKTNAQREACKGNESKSEDETSEKTDKRFGLWSMVTRPKENDALV